MNIRSEKGRKFYTHIAIEVLSKFPTTTLFFSLLAFLPAFFSACSTEPSIPEEDGVRTFSVKAGLTASPSLYPAEFSLDLYIFNDDLLGRLDSHIHFENPGGTLAVSSRKGRKRAVALANAGGRTLEWGEIGSFHNLGTALVRLRDEDVRNPLLCASASFEAGGGDEVFALDMQPLCSRIKLSSISCDFSQTPYSGKELTEVRAYLTNVNTAATVLPGLWESGVEMVNAGGWSDGDSALTPLRSMLLHEFSTPIGTEKVYPGKYFYCYPNKAGEGKTLRTKLVIEGKIDGLTYYYPIAIPPEGGIGRGEDYTVSLTLTRLGCHDPDASLSEGTAEATVSISPWREREEETVTF